jgi:hypothetical protein
MGATSQDRPPWAIGEPIGRRDYELILKINILGCSKTVGREPIGDRFSGEVRVSDTISARDRIF